MLTRQKSPTGAVYLIFYCLLFYDTRSRIDAHTIIGANMKKLLLFATIALVAFPEFTFAQVWKERSSREKNDPVAAKKAKDLLLELFPGDPQAKQIVLTVLYHDPEDKRQNAITDLWSGCCINITPNFANILEKGRKDKYAFIVAHEYSHIQRGHTATVYRKNFFMQVEDFTLLEKQEVEADWDAVHAAQKAGYDVCAAAQVFDELTRSLRFSEEGYRAIALERLGILKMYCYNKNKLQYLRPPYPASENPTRQFIQQKSGEGKTSNPTQDYF